MEGKVIEAQDLALIGKVRKGGKKGPRKGKSDNATYLETRMGSISFWMPSSDVLKAHYVQFVPGFTNNLSILAITNLKCIVELNDQQCTIRDCSQEMMHRLGKKK